MEECENTGNCVFCYVETKTCCGLDYQCDFCESEICLDCFYEYDEICLNCDRKIITDIDLFCHLLKKYDLRRGEVHEEYKKKVMKEEEDKKDIEIEIYVVSLNEYPDLYRETTYGFILKQENDKIVCEKIEDDETRTWRDLTEKEIKLLLSWGVIVPSFLKELTIMKEEYGIDYNEKYKNSELSNKEIIHLLQKNREIEMKKILGKDIASYLNKFYMQI